MGELRSPTVGHARPFAAGSVKKQAQDDTSIIVLALWTSAGNGVRSCCVEQGRIQAGMVYGEREEPRVARKIILAIITDTRDLRYKQCADTTE